MRRAVPLVNARRPLFVRHVLASILPRVLPYAIVAAAYTAVVDLYVSCNLWPSLCGAAGESFLFIHPYGYQAILLCTGYGLVLRLNQSYTRYWECRTGIQNAASKWADAVLMAAAFDDDEGFVGGSAAGPHGDFARACVHLCSLLHAVALHSLRGDPQAGFATLAPRGGSGEDAGGKGGAARAGAPKGTTTWTTPPGAPPPLPPPTTTPWCFDSAASFCARHPIRLIGGVTPDERARLAASPQPVHLVAGWLARLLVRRRRRGGLQHDAPIVSRIYQVISDGNLWYHTSLKVVDTPFPLVYAQFNSMTCLMTLAFFPAIIGDKVASLPLAVALAFCAATTIFGLNEAAKDLEEPFTSELGCWLGGNRLDAPTLQALFDERLMAFTETSLEAARRDAAGSAESQASYEALLDDALGVGSGSGGGGGGAPTDEAASAASESAI